MIELTQSIISNSKEDKNYTSEVGDKANGLESLDDTLLIYARVYKFMLKIGLDTLDEYIKKGTITQDMQAKATQQFIEQGRQSAFNFFQTAEMLESVTDNRILKSLETIGNIISGVSSGGLVASEGLWKQQFEILNEITKRYGKELNTQEHSGGIKEDK